MRILLALTPIGLLGWLAIQTLGGWALVAALAVLGLAAIGALIGWMTGGLRRWL